jgi:hypothetical protein
MVIFWALENTILIISTFEALWFLYLRIACYYYFDFLVICDFLIRKQVIRLQLLVALTALCILIVALAALLILI